MIPRVMLAVAVFALAGCGGDSGSGAQPDVSLSPAGLAGFEVFNANGCQACHGANGEGGVGPRLQGLAGHRVELQGGAVVTADDEYLARSIRDPNADKVKGYNIPMPQNGLSDDEIAAVLDFLHDIADASAIPGL